MECRCPPTAAPAAAPSAPCRVPDHNEFDEVSFRSGPVGLGAPSASFNLDVGSLGGLVGPAHAWTAPALMPSGVSFSREDSFSWVTCEPALVLPSLPSTVTAPALVAPTLPPQPYPLEPTHVRSTAPASSLFSCTSKFFSALPAAEVEVDSAQLTVRDGVV